MEGAESRMSLINRVAGASQPRRPNSARYVPARMPIGVPISVAVTAIIRLPTIALSSPPWLPGGGVICVNNDSSSAPKPFCSSTIKIHASQNRPKIMVNPEMNSMAALTMRRRR